MINQIGKITIYANNQEEAIKFWTEKMNFVIKFEQQMGPNMKWVEVAPSNECFTTFVLYEKEMMLKQNPNANVSHPNIILSTMDLTKAYDEMKNNGVAVGEIMSMLYGKMVPFKDQDGNQYLLREDLVK